MGTLLLSTAMMLAVLATTLLGVCREPLLLMGGGTEYRLHVSAAGALLCALVVPAYVVLLRSWTRTRMTVVLGVGLAAGILVTYVLGQLNLYGGLACTLMMSTLPLFVVHLWSVASDVSVDAGLRRLPWLMLGGSLGALVPHALFQVIWVHLGSLTPLLLAAGAVLAATGAEVVHSGREAFQQFPVADMSEPAVPPTRDAAYGGIQRLFLLLLAAFTLASSCMGALADAGLGDEATRPGWRVAVLAVGGLGAFLVVAPLLRRFPGALLVLWPATVLVTQVGLVAGAGGPMSDAFELSASVTATIGTVAAQAVLLATPRGTRYAARMALAFWVQPAGRLLAVLAVALLVSSSARSTTQAVAALVAMATVGLAIGIGRAFGRSAERTRLEAPHSA
ncbi:MAG: hypothetical protein WKG00_12410 [Polyangiaceae bacterium]